MLGAFRPNMKPELLQKNKYWPSNHSESILTIKRTYRFDASIDLFLQTSFVKFKFE